jgi:four helix bundle protein
MNRFKELKVWQKSVDLATEVYKVTGGFPKEEKFGLTSQVNRSAVSIASNIAEGAGRGSKKEFHNFLSIANGSSYELETQLLIASKLNFIEEDDFKSINEKIDEIQKMIYALKRKLKTEISESSILNT